MKIAILDDYQGVAMKMADWNSLPKSAQIIVLRNHLTGIKTLAEQLADCDMVTTMRERTPFDQMLFERLPNLKLLVTTGMQNASINLDAATQLGIMVCGTEGHEAGGTHVSELAWGLILALMRNIVKEDAAIRQGHWQTTIGTTLYGRVLGILGLGHLGSQMATLGHAFGMPVIAWSQNLTAQKALQYHATLVEKEELFARSDILTIHLRLGDRTRGIVGARELSLMKPTAFLINTSRGPIVDEKAIIQALQTHSIAGAGLDVFDQEPLPLEHPFKHLDNVVMTPHLGYVTNGTYQLMYPQIVDDILAYLRGQPIRVMNPAVLASNRSKGNKTDTKDKISGG